MSVNLSFIGGAGWQFFDNNGNPLAGGKIYTYVAGTTTPQATFTGRDGLTANTNPIILDAAGRTPSQVWSTEGVLYKYTVTTSADVSIRVWDNIGGSVVASDFAQTLAAPSGASLVGYLPAGTAVTVAAVDLVAGIQYIVLSSGSPSLGAIGSIFTATGSETGTGTASVYLTVQAKLRESVSVLDFGAVGDGVTDDRPAVEAAINSLILTGGTVCFPPGKYLLNSYSSDAPLVLAYGQILPIVSNVSIYGAAGHEIIVGTFFDDKGFTLFGGLNSITLSSCTPLRNVRFTNLNVNFSGTANLMRTAYRLRVIIQFGYVLNGTVEGCNFYNGDLSNGVASGVKYGTNDIRGEQLYIINNTFDNLVQQNDFNLDFTTIYNGAARTVISNNVFKESSETAATRGCAIEMHNSHISANDNIITGYTRAIWFVSDSAEVLHPLGQSATNNTAYVTNAFAYIWCDTGTSIDGILCANNTVFCAHIDGYTELYNGKQGLVSSSNPSGTGEVLAALFTGNIVNIEYTLPAYPNNKTAAFFDRPFSNITIKGNQFFNTSSGIFFTDGTKEINGLNISDNVFNCTNAKSDFFDISCSNLLNSAVLNNTFTFQSAAPISCIRLNVGGTAINCRVSGNKFTGVSPSDYDVSLTSGAFPGSNNKYEYYWYGASLEIPSLAIGAFGLAKMIGITPPNFITFGSQITWVGDGDPGEVAISTTTSANSANNAYFLCANKSAGAFVAQTTDGAIKLSHTI